MEQQNPSFPASVFVYAAGASPSDLPKSMSKSRGVHSSAYLLRRLNSGNRGSGKGKSLNERNLLQTYSKK